eukprot:GHRQ01008718.1.p1 GENE.GHRQ01008718.1~~GHRQ01008718.1.p1  ORF type:complete len:320 (+),score=112.78 GHRQ01008718.1:201-1160(+)
MAARRGLGITSKDMEASRLVFCFVKDSKPKRKVAIPVPDSYTWEQFLDQVKAKLKLSGVAEICFSSNGQQVRSVSELQDIDELCVVEGPDAVANGGAVSSYASAMQRTAAELPLESAATEVLMSPSMRQQSIPQDRHKVVVSADGMQPTQSASYAADEEDRKYARRAHPLKRTLQRLFPGMFAPGLPVTVRDAQDSSEGSSRPAGRRRRRRSPFDARNLLLVLAVMSCAFTMLYLFLRVSSSPGVGGMGPAQQAVHDVTEVGQAAAAVATGAAGAAADAAKAVAGGGGAGATAGDAAPGAPLGSGVGAQAAVAGGGGVP